jgi:hypothetical protein
MSNVEENNLVLSDSDSDSNNDSEDGRLLREDITRLIDTPPISLSNSVDDLLNAPLSQPREDVPLERFNRIINVEAGQVLPTRFPLLFPSNRRIVSSRHYTCPEPEGDEEASGVLLECVICHTNEINTTAFPCMHASMCSTCSHAMSTRDYKCPICRTEIVQVAKIYISKKRKTCNECGDDGESKKHKSSSSLNSSSLNSSSLNSSSSSSASLTSNKQND